MSDKTLHFTEYEPSATEKAGLVELSDHELVSLIQPLMNKSHLTDLTDSEDKQLGQYLWEYARRDLDLSYFTVGAGAPGDCVIM